MILSHGHRYTPVPTPYMYVMRGQLLWHIRILPGLSFISLYYTPSCGIIEAEEISFWAAVFSAAKQFTDLRPPCLSSRKHGQTIVFGLSPHEWGAQLGQTFASLAKLFVDTKVSNKCQPQHQIFYGHTNFQHKFIILELDANEYCQLDLIP